MANYGDAALNLGPEWARYKESDQNFALQIVGHKDGESDVRLKDEPNKRHQFAWVDTKYRDDIAINLTKGYRFVKKDEGWVKAEELWEWDAEGFLVWKTMRLMARPIERLVDDMAKRKQQRERVMGTNKAEEEAAELAARAGIQITGDDKPRRRGARG